MKAAILVESKKSLVVDDIDLPADLQYGQVLVKIHYSGICGAQLNEIDAVKGPDKFLPHLLGHEGGGVVEKCGPGVTTVKPGDHVVLHWRKGQGIQAPTAQYTWGGKKINSGWVTTFSEYSIVSENRLTPIPKDVDLKIAALYGCALTTGFGVVHNDARLKSGESVVIVGAGGAGLAIILASSLASAYPIIAIDINDLKLEKAKKFGATHLINSKNVDARKKISEIVPGGLDVAIETTGIIAIREMCYEITHAEGRTVLVGVPPAKEKISIDSFPLHFNKRITGSHGGDSNPTYDIPRLLKLQASGRFDPSGMITHEFPLAEVNEAIDLMRSGQTLRCVLNMSGNGDPKSKKKR